VALLQQYTPDNMYTEEDLLTFANKLLAFRDENFGYNNPEHFVNTLTGAGEYLTVELKDGDKGKARPSGRHHRQSPKPSPSSPRRIRRGPGDPARGDKAGRYSALLPGGVRCRRR